MSLRAASAAHLPNDGTPRKTAIRRVSADRTKLLGSGQGTDSDNFEERPSNHSGRKQGSSFAEGAIVIPIGTDDEPFDHPMVPSSPADRAFERKFTSESVISTVSRPRADRGFKNSKRMSRGKGHLMRARSKLFAAVPTAEETLVNDLPIRRNSWLAIGGGDEADKDLLRVSNDDLQEAALRGDVGLVRRLVNAGASVNAPMRPESADDFMTLLHVLASKPDVPNSARLVAEIIRMRANLDARSTSGSTPLACACKNNHSGAVEVLLEAGASAEPIDDYGNTALVCLISSLPYQEPARSSKGGKTFFPQPSPTDQSLEIIGLLSKAKADMNKAGDFVPIMKAIEAKQEPFVRGLIQNGAKPMGLHLALETAPVGVVRALTDAEVNPFERGPGGKTPMDIALARGQGDILTLLRDYIGDLQRLNHRYLETQKEEMTRASRVENAHDRSNALQNLNDQSKPYSSGKRRCIPDSVLDRFHSVQAQCRRLLKNRPYQVVMFTVLIVALFIADVWVILNIADTLSLDLLLMLILLLFLAEFIIQMLGMGRTYMCTFFFWMDLVGVFSVPLDHSIVNDLLAGSSAASNNTIVLRAARMAKLGARAGRFTKLLKLLRFLPGVKDQGAHVGTAKVIASKLNTALSTRVSCLIIIMVMVLPVFELFMYPTDDESIRSWLDVIHGTYIDFTTDIDDLVADMQGFYSERNYFPFELHVVGTNGSSRMFSLGSAPARTQAITKIALQGSETYALFNFEDPHRNDAISNVFLIITIIVILLGSAFLLSNSISAIVIVPLEALLADVKRITGHIFYSVNKMAKKKPKAVDLGDEPEVDTSDDEGMEDAFGNETQGLETVLKKLGVLSQIMTNKHMGVTDDMGEEMRGWLQEYTIRDEERASASDGESDESESWADPEELKHEIEDRLEESSLDFETYCNWDLDILALSDAKMKAICVCAITEHRGYLLSDACGECMDWGDAVTNFVDAIEKGHDGDNPYHNFSHAADICHTTNQFLRMCHAEHFFSYHERLALIVGAIAHDLGHPGLSSAHVTETGHELALMYNDMSPLEHMSCAAVFEITSHPDSAIFCELQHHAYREVRRALIEAILCTDSRHHAALTKDIQNLYDINHDLFDIAEMLYKESDGETYPVIEIVEFFRGLDVKKQIRNLVLHYCDNSNAMKPWTLCHAWAALAQEEFFLQGDREKELGLPVAALNDREKANSALSQIGLLDFFVVPMAQPAERLLHPLHKCMDTVLENMNQWIKEWVTTTDPPPDQEEQNKIKDRIAKIEEKRNSGQLRSISRRQPSMEKFHSHAST